MSYLISNLRFARLVGTNPKRDIAILSAIYLVIVIFFVIKTEGIPVGLDQAEHFSVYMHGYNLLHYDFFESYGLIDESPSSDPADHPLVYIHGSALAPRLFTFSLLWLGIESIYTQALIFVVLTAVWIPLAYLALLNLLKNGHLAFLGTLLVATEYNNVLMHSFNLGRGWMIFIFFYLFWASSQLDFQMSSRGQYLHLGLAVFLAVSYELPFAGLCLLISAYVLYWRNRLILKTILILGIFSLLPLLMLAVQVILYLGGITELVSYAVSSFSYRLAFINYDYQLQQLYQNKQILIWQNTANPVSTLINLIPNLTQKFVAKNGLWLSGFVVVSNVFVIYYYLFKRPKQQSRDKTFFFNPAYFVLFFATAIFAVTLLFPSAIVFYTEWQWFPLVIFFIFISVPIFLSWTQHLPAGPVIIGVFAIIWGTSQIQSYLIDPPRPDTVLKKLRQDYSATSFAANSFYPWQALWFAVGSSSLLTPQLEETYHSDFSCYDYVEHTWCYHPTFTYLNHREKFPEYLLVSKETDLRQILNVPNIVIDAAYEDEYYGKVLVLKLADDGNQARSIGLEKLPSESLQDPQELQAYYRPQTGPTFDLNSREATTKSEADEDIPVQAGDLIFSGSTLLKVTSDGLIKLNVTSGQRVHLVNLGAWNTVAQSYSGLDAIYRLDRWFIDVKGFEPAQIYDFVHEGVAFQLLPQYDILGIDDEFEIELIDNGQEKPFIRIKALADIEQLEVVINDILRHVENVPLTINGAIRASGTGLQTLSLSNKSSALHDNKKYTSTYPASQIWTTMMINVGQIDSFDQNNMVSLGLTAMKKGDWFDIRDLQVFVGRLPISDRTGLTFPEQLSSEPITMVRYLAVPLHKIRSGLPITSTLTGDSILLNLGDLVLKDNYLLRVESDRLIPLLGVENQKIFVENLGSWDIDRHTYGGLPAIFLNGQWVIETETLTPFDINLDLSNSTETNLIPGFWISPGDAGYEITLMADHTGAFIRIKATSDNSYLVLNGQSPLPELDGAPVSIQAQIRTNGKGQQRLTLFDKINPTETQSYVTEATKSGEWNALRIPTTWVTWPDSSDNYSIGLFDVRAGDWFDIRELKVYVGRLPQ